MGVSVANLMLPVASLATAPLLTRTLGTVGRGEVAGGTSVVMLAIAAGTLGIPEAATYLLAGRRGRPGAVARRSLVVLVAAGTVLSCLIVAAADRIAGGQGQLASLIRLAALAVAPALVVAGLRGVAAGLGAWTTVNRERVLLAGLRVAGLLLLAAAGRLSVSAAVVVIALAPGASVLVYLPIISRLLRSPEAPSPDPTLAVEPDPGAAAGGYRVLLRFGGTVWVGSVSGILLARLDQVMMTPLASTAQLGLYAVAVNLGELPLLASAALRDVILSSHAAQPQVDRATRAARLSTLGSLLIAVPVAVTMPLWISVLFGAGFRDCEPAAVLVLAAAVLGAPGSVAGAVLTAEGRAGLRSVSLVAASVLNVGLLVLLVPSHGALGAALATLSGCLLAGYTNIYFVVRYLGYPAGDLLAVRRDDVTFLRGRFVALRLKGWTA